MWKLKCKSLLLAACLLTASLTAEAGQYYQRLNSKDFPNATLSVIDESGKQFAVLEACAYELGVADFMASADQIIAYGVLENNRLHLYAYTIQRGYKDGAFAYTQNVDNLVGNQDYYGEEYVYQVSHEGQNLRLSAAKSTNPEAGGYYQFSHSAEGTNFRHAGLRDFIAGYKLAHPEFFPYKVTSMNDACDLIYAYADAKGLTQYNVMPGGGGSDYYGVELACSGTTEKFYVLDTGEIYKLDEATNQAILIK